MRTSSLNSWRILSTSPGFGNDACCNIFSNSTSSLCRRIQAGHGSYLVGLKYCSSCEVYLYHDGTFYSCCGRQLRTRPNNKKGKERLRLRQWKK